MPVKHTERTDRRARRQVPGRQITNRFGHTPPAAALVTRHTDDKISGAGSSLAQLRSPRCCSKDKTDASATRSALLQGRRRKPAGVRDQNDRKPPRRLGLGLGLGRSRMYLRTLFARACSSRRTHREKAQQECPLGRDLSYADRGPHSFVTCVVVPDQPPIVERVRAHLRRHFLSEDLSRR